MSLIDKKLHVRFTLNASVICLQDRAQKIILKVIACKLDMQSRNLKLEMSTANEYEKRKKKKEIEKKPQSFKLWDPPHS